MNFRKIAAVILSVALILCSTAGCEEEKVMNTETSRIVMDDFINQQRYAIKITYEDMNCEFYYARDNHREILETLIASSHSAIIRINNETYYADSIGSGQLRLIKNDPTDINYAKEILNTIYKQTVVKGKLIKSSSVGKDEEMITIDYYDYLDTDSSGETIQWAITIQNDRIIKAARLTDKRTFVFEYPQFSEKVFEIPDDYEIIEEEYSELE